MRETADGAEPAWFADWRRSVASRGSKRERILLAFHNCHADVFTVAHRITGDRWDAEDVTQAAMEVLMKRIHDLPDPAKVGPFLRECAVRCSLATLRKRGRRRPADRGKPEPTTAPRAMGAALVGELLDLLEPQERVVVVLKYGEQHTLAEVAELTRLSVATVRRRIDGVRDKLREHGRSAEDLTALLGADGEAPS